MSISRTPLARARGLGSAKSGTADFWRQRVTSVLGLPLIAGAILVIVSNIGADYRSAIECLRRPAVAILLLLTILNFCVHMRIGMQIIIEDYIHNETAKALLLIANTGFVAAAGVAGALALVKIAAVG